MIVIGVRSIGVTDRNQASSVTDVRRSA